MLLPNQLTVLRIILTPVFVYFFLADGDYHLEISIVIYIVAALTDWYDGWLARKFNYITAWGKFWDPMADKILTSAAFLCFVILDIIPLWMVLLIVLRDLFVTTVRGYVDYKNLNFPTSTYAKVKTFIQMIFLYYLLVFYTLSVSQFSGENVKSISFLMLNEHFIYYIMLLITIITVHSGYVYIKQNYDLILKAVKE
ncbi:MAG: CDP-diacylglycerol--glycerol-3-phosphate 3-phosphatidyltransferase [Ignavibacteriaceae bacterium]|nr:CDP-diacylglycerol--glycerol-3-phosphate 3-phosphatidyltransferase [Ignavibacteriaceae bacterium]